MENKTFTTTLPCGIGFAFKRSYSEVAYCALTIKSGTRNESGYGNGTAHFTEHLLFKGTQGKSAEAINNCIERSGGELNAFTTKEETVIHATLLKDELPKGAALLMELAFKSLFRENDIETERNVIIDEIQSYKDSPPETIYDHFEELLFEGTDLAPQILGSIRSVKAIKKKDIDGYVKENFRFENTVLSIVADIDCKKALDIATRAASKCGLTPDGVITGASAGLCHTRPHILCRELKEGKTFDLTLNKRNHQANCIIGCTGYPIGAEKERIALILLCNILGGPAANSVLNMRLREKNGWVYGVDASYTPYTDNGAVAISFGCDKEKIDRCIAEISSILGKFREKPISDNLLKAAKKQLKGQLLISSDNGEQKCISIGKNLLFFGTDADESKAQEILDGLVPQDITACANEIFAPERLSRLIYI